MGTHTLVGLAKSRVRMVVNHRATALVGGIIGAGFVFCALIIHSGVGRVALEDDQVEEPKDYYISAFPPGGRKGVGDAFQTQFNCSQRDNRWLLCRSWFELRRPSFEQVQ